MEVQQTSFKFKMAVAIGVALIIFFPTWLGFSLYGSAEPAYLGFLSGVVGGILTLIREL